MNSILERLRKLRRLTWAERLCLGQAWALLWTLDVALLVAPFRSVLNFLQQVPPSAIRLPLSAATDVPRLAWLVECAAIAGPASGPCLRQSLALLYMLRRRGQEGHLRIGVAREAGCLKAHAWLVQHGRIILGSRTHGRFEPLFTQPDGASVS